MPCKFKLIEFQYKPIYYSFIWNLYELFLGLVCGPCRRTKACGGRGLQGILSNQIGPTKTIHFEYIIITNTTILHRLIKTTVINQPFIINMVPTKGIPYQVNYQHLYTGFLNYFTGCLFCLIVCGRWTII